MRAQRQPLPGHRWHFQHGPIDLVIAADGDERAVFMAHERAWLRFEGVLTELVHELPLLRQPVSACRALQGRIAQRMWQACNAFSPEFITPMAAVAGAVAQEIIQAYHQPGIRRAWVNNGGDIALHLAPGQSARVGLFADLSHFDADALARTATGTLRTDAGFTVDHASPVRGVATSGWRGRSHSLGIADSVTVLAATAAQADAAATVVANAVNVAEACIRRAPASSLRDDSDLGERLVTVDVPPLPPALVQQALDSGLTMARHLQRDGLLQAALLACQGSLARLAPAGALELV
jgi:hypothetical protein